MPLLKAVLGQDGVAHHEKCSTVQEGAQKRCVAVHTLGAQMDHGPAMKRRLAPVVEDVLEGDEFEGRDLDEFEGLNAPKLDSQEPVTGLSKEKHRKENKSKRKQMRANALRVSTCAGVRFQ